MPRLHLFEFEDLRWFPQVIRTGMMDFLRHMITWLNFYEPVAPYIRDTLVKTGEDQLVELCAGGGGGVLKLKENLDAVSCYPKIILTDLYPNISSYVELNKMTNGTIDYISQPIDALDVHPELKGMRVLFSSFHHFRPAEAGKILSDAVRKNNAIGIFDTGTRNLLIIPAILLLQPVIFFLATPFFRPFRWSRLFFTYIVPLIPLCTMWDGCVSVLRFYTLKELKNLSSQVNGHGYIWKCETVRNRIGTPVNYLIGYPKNTIKES